MRLTVRTPLRSIFFFFRNGYQRASFTLSIYWLLSRKFSLYIQGGYWEAFAYCLHICYITRVNRDQKITACNVNSYKVGQSCACTIKDETWSNPGMMIGPWLSRMLPVMLIKTCEDTTNWALDLSALHKPRVASLSAKHGASSCCKFRPGFGKVAPRLPLAMTSVFTVLLVEFCISSHAPR